MESVRETGLNVELVVEGEPQALSPGLELSAYRIVQEALTNTLKHARAARAHVAIRYEASHLLLEVIDNGCGSAAEVNGSGGGHGLIGMRERVLLYGGELDARAEPGGGFAVRVRLPLEATAR